MSFAAKLVAWQRRHGRHGLPWQGTRDPYRIWLSEVMLQQTQVERRHSVLRAISSGNTPARRHWRRRPEDEVLQLWSGLGYYARGRNLHKAAREIERDGFPRSAEKLAELPGVGRSTAAAIAVFAFGERAAILDGNVKRVLSRCYGVDGPKTGSGRSPNACCRRKEVEIYTQGLMDLGATVCTRNPECGRCPVKARCVARRTGRIGELPAARPRKALPLQAHDLVRLSERRQACCSSAGPRPAYGADCGAFPDKAVLKAKATRRLEPIDHGFTHFRLRIQPLLCDVKV